MQNLTQTWRVRASALLQATSVSPAPHAPADSEVAGLASLLPENPLIETPHTARLRRDLKAAVPVLQPARRPPSAPSALQLPWPQPPEHQLDLASGIHKALHSAIQAGKRQVVDEFIHIQPFRIDDRDEFGRTALHIAAEQGDTSIARKLLKGMEGVGADIQARTFFGLTPLHAAAAAGRHDVVLLLISSGADRLAVSDFNATALDLADLHGHQSVVQTLRRLNVRASRGWALPPRKIETLKKLCQAAGPEPVARSLGVTLQRLDALLQGPARMLVA